MPRVGLVLGSGGQMGYCFTAGVLWGLAEVTGWDARSADVVVGTSSGAQVAALLRAGVSAEDIARHASDRDLSEEAADAAKKMGGFVPPPRPQPLLPVATSFRYLSTALLRPWRMRPGPFLTAALPAGRVSATVMADGIFDLFSEWPAERLWICALDVDRGQRVVFGREGSPSVDVGTGVSASVALPGWFAPVVIEGRRCVDATLLSPTSLDLLAGEALDLVIVVAPLSYDLTEGMTMPNVDMPLRVAGRRLLRAEERRVRRSGTSVVLFQPLAADLHVMGSNLMADGHSRRHSMTLRAYRSTLRRLTDQWTAEKLTPLGW